MKTVLAALAVVLTSSTEGGSWTYSRQSDAMSDRPTIRETLALADHSALQFECDAPGKKSVNVTFYGRSDDWYGTGRREIAYRFDDRSPVKSFAAYYDKAAMLAYHEYGMAFLRGLMNAKVVRIRLTDYRGSTSDLTFDVSAARDPALRILKECEGLDAL